MSVTTRFDCPPNLEFVPSELGDDADWPCVLEKLGMFRELADDWDGQGAVAPDAAVVASAIRLATQFHADGRPCPEFALAGVNGTVIFEWHLADGYLEVEVTAQDAAEQRWVAKGSDVVEVSQLGRRS
jgi:hypothetical protein